MLALQSRPSVSHSLSAISSAGSMVSAIHVAVLEMGQLHAWLLHDDGSASLPNPGTPWFTAVTREEDGGYAVRQRLTEGQGYAIHAGRSPRLLVGWAEQAVASWQAAGLGGTVDEAAAA